MKRTGYPGAMSLMRVHPAQLIADVDPLLFPEAANAIRQFAGVKAKRLGDMVETALDLPYPADPALEPDCVGLTYAQVAVLKQVKAAAMGDGYAFDRVMDRAAGKPVATKVVGKVSMRYTDFLDGIKNQEAIDVNGGPSIDP